MATCPKCGGRLDAMNVQCPHCGHDPYFGARPGRPHRARSKAVEDLFLAAWYASASAAAVLAVAAAVMAGVSIWHGPGNAWSVSGWGLLTAVGCLALAGVFAVAAFFIDRMRAEVLTDINRAPGPPSEHDEA